MKELKRTGAVVLLMLSFVMISALGLLPKTISVNLPPSLQSYSSMLPFTGFTIDDRSDNEPDSKTFATGTFDRLNLFDNANIRYNGYYNSFIKKFVWSNDGGLNKIKEKNLAKTAWNIFEDSNIKFYPVVRKGSYYFFLHDGKVLVHCGKKQSYTLIAGCENSEELISLLEKQTSARITLQEFCNLLTETSNGRLLRFNPKVHTALLCETLENGNRQVIQWNTETMEQTVVLDAGDYSEICACSDTELTYYDGANRQMIYCDFSTMKMTRILDNIDCPDAVNFMWWDKDELIILFTTGTFVQEANTKSKKYRTWDFGDETYFRLLCGSKSAFISNNKYHSHIAFSTIDD